MDETWIRREEGNGMQEVYNCVYMFYFLNRNTLKRKMAKCYPVFIRDDGYAGYQLFHFFSLVGMFEIFSIFKK